MLRCPLTITITKKIYIQLRIILLDKEMFSELVYVFNEAWLLLKNELKNHGKY